MDAVAVGQVEPQRVELPARHRDRDAGTVGRILEREEDALPRALAAELGHLALDPDGREAREPVADPAVERRDGVDLPVSVLLRLDLHAPAQTSAERAPTRPGGGSEQDLGRDLV